MRFNKTRKLRALSHGDTCMVDADHALFMGAFTEQFSYRDAGFVYPANVGRTIHLFFNKKISSRAQHIFGQNISLKNGMRLKRYLFGFYTKDVVKNERRGSIGFIP